MSPRAELVTLAIGSCNAFAWRFTHNLISSLLLIEVIRATVALGVRVSIVLVVVLSELMLLDALNSIHLQWKHVRLNVHLDDNFSTSSSLLAICVLTLRSLHSILSKEGKFIRVIYTAVPFYQYNIYSTETSL